MQVQNLLNFPKELKVCPLLMAGCVGVQKLYSLLQVHEISLSIVDNCDF